jgi:hypothetical protein
MRQTNTTNKSKTALKIDIKIFSEYLKCSKEILKKTNGG